ncbi:unnamed protein product [Pedinophyceae sp. YPF-701]|nr:unnamed protein product [Pedinophyceae sp. YPF-701]
MSGLVTDAARLAGLAEGASRLTSMEVMRHRVSDLEGKMKLRVIVDHESGREEQVPIGILARSIERYATMLVAGRDGQGGAGVPGDLDGRIHTALRALDNLVSVANHGNAYAKHVRAFLGDKSPGHGGGGATVSERIVELCISVTCWIAAQPIETADGRAWGRGKDRCSSAVLALSLLRSVLSVRSDRVLSQDEEDDVALLWKEVPAAFLKADVKRKGGVLRACFQSCANMLQMVSVCLKTGMKMLEEGEDADCGDSISGDEEDEPENTDSARARGRDVVEAACAMAKQCYRALDDVSSLCAVPDFAKRVLSTRPSDVTTVVAQLDIFGSALALHRRVQDGAALLLPPVSLHGLSRDAAPHEDASKPAAPAETLSALELCAAQGLACWQVLAEYAGEGEDEPCGPDVYCESDPEGWAHGKVKERNAEVMATLLAECAACMEPDVCTGDNRAMGRPLLPGTGQADLNLMRVVELFSNDTNYRREIMDALAGPCARLLAQPMEVFRSYWCMGRAAIDVHRSDWEEVFSVTETSIFHRARTLHAAAKLMGPTNNMHESLARGSALARCILLFKLLGNLKSYYEGTCEEYLRTYFVEQLAARCRDIDGQKGKEIEDAIQQLKSGNFKGGTGKTRRINASSKTGRRILRSLQRADAQQKKRQKNRKHPAVEACVSCNVLVRACVKVQRVMRDDGEAIMTDEEVDLTQAVADALAEEFPDFAVAISRAVAEVKREPEDVMFGALSAAGTVANPNKWKIPNIAHRHIEVVSAAELEEEVESYREDVDFRRITTVGTQRVIDDQDIMDMDDDAHDDVDPHGHAASSDSDCIVRLPNRGAKKRTRKTKNGEAAGGKRARKKKGDAEDGADA